MEATYSKRERLKSKILIDRLFTEGKTIGEFPLRLVYMPASFEDGVAIKTGISVGKQHFKKAVDRNRIKRMVREAYRLNKQEYFNNITTQYALMILYIGKEIPTNSELENSMKNLLNTFSKVAS